MGSNHFLIQPQTVGKKDGAPIIYTCIRLKLSDILLDRNERCLQKFDLAFLGNEQLPADWHPACEFSNSRTALSQLWRYLLYCLIDQRETRGLVVLAQRNTMASRIESSSHTEQKGAAFSTAMGP